MSDFSLNLHLEAFENISKVFTGIKEKSSNLIQSFSNIKQSLGSSEELFEELKNEQAQLNNQLGQVQGVMKQEQALSQLANQMQEAREKSRELKVQLKTAKEAGEGERAISKLSASYEKAKQSSQSLFNKHKLMNSKLTEQKQRLQEAGINTKHLAQSEQSLKSRIEQTNQSLNRQASRLDLAAKKSEKLAQIKEKLSKRLETSSNASLTGLGMVTAGKGILDSMFGAGQSLMGFVDTASTFEGFRATLETIEGSSEKASKSLDWVSQFAAKTPYELDNVMESFVKLKSYGLDPTNGLLKTLGDTASAMGKGLDQAVEAMADAVNGENERLKEFGITSETKGNKITYSYVHDGKEIKKSVNKNDKKKIEQALSEIFNKKYAGSMEKQSQTFSGMISNLMDTWTRFQTMVMSSGLFDGIKNKLQGVLDTLEEMSNNGELQEWAKNIGDTLKDLFESAWETGKSLFSMIKSFAEFAREHTTLITLGIKLAAVIAGLSMVFGGLFMIFAGGYATYAVVAKIFSSLAALGPIAAIITNLKLAFVGFFTAIKTGFLAMLANPAILAFVAVIAVIAGLAYVIYQNWDSLKVKFIAIWEAITTSVGEAWNSITETINTAFNTIVQIISGFDFLALFQKAFGKALAWAEGAFQKVKEWLGFGDDEIELPEVSQGSNTANATPEFVKNTSNIAAQQQQMPDVSKSIPTLGLAEVVAKQPKIESKQAQPLEASRPIKAGNVQNTTNHGPTTITIQVQEAMAKPEDIAKAVNQALAQNQMALEARNRRRLTDA